MSHKFTLVANKMKQQPRAAKQTCFVSVKAQHRHHVTMYCLSHDQVLSGGSGVGVGGTTITTRAGLREAVPAYSRARPENSAPG